MNTIKSSIRFIATVVLVSAAFPATAQEDNFITVVSWGGSYARSSVKAYHERFVQETGIQIKLDEYNGGLAQIRAQAETGNVSWDVVDMEAGDALLGCDWVCWKPWTTKPCPRPRTGRRRRRISWTPTTWIAA